MSYNTLFAANATTGLSPASLSELHSVEGGFLELAIGYFGQKAAETLTKEATDLMGEIAYGIREILV